MRHYPPDSLRIQKLGRVNLGNVWKTTSYLCVTNSHAGSGKGFYFIPEIGEEVFVAFEGGNPEKPFVLGTQYNGKEISGYNTSGNDQKVIHTRSGTKMIFNDAQGSIFIEDPSGNTYLMDGQGNISVNAPKNMDFVAGENMNFQAGMNITSSAGTSITETAGMNHSISAGGFMNQSAVGNYSLLAANILEITQGEKKSKSKEVKEVSKNRNIQSEEANKIHSQKKFKNNSAEGTNSY